MHTNDDENWSTLEGSAALGFVQHSSSLTSTSRRRANILMLRRRSSGQERPFRLICPFVCLSATLSLANRASGLGSSRRWRATQLLLWVYQTCVEVHRWSSRHKRPTCPLAWVYKTCTQLHQQSGKEEEEEEKKTGRRKRRQKGLTYLQLRFTQYNQPFQCSGVYVCS